MVREKQLTTGEETQMTPVAMQLAQTESFANLVRDLAQNPNVDPDKLGKLLDLHERVLEKSAKQLYDDAMRLAQEEMNFVRTDKANPHAQSRYATYKALDKSIRKIYTKHGFSVSFDTGLGKESYGPVQEGCIRILMDIAHSSGHQVQKHMDIFVETTGSQGSKVMTRIHATGSAMSYGKRYLLIFGFNLAVGEEDDDGNKAGGVGRQGSGEDHKIKSDGAVRQPTAKSDRKKEGEQSPAAARENDKWPEIVKASGVGDRCLPSSVNTLKATMKRFKISNTEFEDAFGFPVEELKKAGLNSVLDWIKGREG